MLRSVPPKKDLKGIAASERLVIDADRTGAINAFHPDHANAMDEYLLKAARKRRDGQIAV